MKIFMILSLVLTSNISFASTWLDEVSNQVNSAAFLNCGDYPNIEPLQAKFKCEDALLTVSNALYKGWLKSDKIVRKDSLLCFWDKGSPQSEFFNEIFANPIVRLNVASLIGQLNRVTFLTVDVKEQKQYVRTYLNDRNTMFALDSISALGWVGENKDVAVLLKIISEEKEGLAENAVLSIINLQTNDYKKTLSEVIKYVKRKSLKIFINDNI